MNMVIGVIGAGAVGGYYGAMLRKAGHEVIFLARGQHLEAMKTDGLQVHSKFGSFHVDATFTDDLSELSKADLLLFTVKSTETRLTADNILPFLKADAVVCTLQNGVDNEETLSEIFGAERVLSGAAYISSKVEAPGVIRQNGPHSLLIGALHPSKEEYVQSLADLFGSAGVECKTSTNIVVRKWDKLLWNVTFNPLSAASMVTVGEILDDPYLRQTADSVLQEAVKVGTALGISINHKVAEQIIPGAEVVRGHKTSMLQDRERGRKMEVESICGYFVHKAQACEVETPVLNTLYSILSAANRKTDPLA
jgi:2-dehydropantoate 2-reductase